MDESEDRRWKVGELAGATGLTVRTLHHYDDVGLLSPTERTSAGHRLYAEEDVQRLYRVLALRRLGMHLEEIASLLDGDEVGLVGLVRRHLEQVERELDDKHMLRDRLRRILEALERSVEPSAEQFIDAMEAMTTIEAKVRDVLIQVPPEELDEPPPRLGRERYRVVLLKERGGERVLPIWIGAQEGDALVLQHEQPEGESRPMTPDLTARLLKAGGVRVERVVIERIRDTTYYATVTVTSGGESQEVDARPSDALNLAVRVDAPVFVAAELIDQAGIPEARLAFFGESGGLAEPHPYDGTKRLWRSLSPELRRSLYPAEAASVFERFTGQARQVVTLAREEARALGHGHVRPEHVLLGLLREEEGLAAGVLASLDITPERVRGQLMRGSDEEGTGGFMAPTPAAEQIFERALREEDTMLPGKVDTEHILLGLMAAEEEALLDLDLRVEVAQVRQETYRAISALPGDEPAAGQLPPSTT